VSASKKLAARMASYRLPPGPRGDTPSGTMAPRTNHGGRNTEQLYGEAWRKYDERRRARSTRDGGPVDPRFRPLPNTQPRKRSYRA
jgi:hypothetical protein